MRLPLDVPIQIVATYPSFRFVSRVFVLKRRFNPLFFSATTDDGDLFRLEAPYAEYHRYWWGETNWCVDGTTSLVVTGDSAKLKFIRAPTLILDYAELTVSFVETTRPAEFVRST